MRKQIEKAYPGTHKCSIQSTKSDAQHIGAWQLACQNGTAKLKQITQRQPDVQVRVFSIRLCEGSEREVQDPITLQAWLVEVGLLTATRNNNNFYFNNKTESL